MGVQEKPVVITASWDEVVGRKLGCTFCENNDCCQLKSTTAFSHIHVMRLLL